MTGRIVVDRESLRATSGRMFSARESDFGGSAGGLSSGGVKGDVGESAFDIGVAVYLLSGTLV